MASAPDISDTALPASPRADHGPRCPGHTPAITAWAAEELSLPPAVIGISQHHVNLGAAAATGVTPSFEDDLDADDVAIARADASANTPAAPERNGWIATLLRLITTSPQRRSPSRRYPARLNSGFMSDACMAREMYRL